MKVLFLGSTAALLMSTPAAAQESASDDATMAGFRIEARGGYDNPEMSVNYDDGVDTIDVSDGTDGVTYGGEIGYDLPLGSAVVGLYAGLDFANTDVCSEVYGNDEACIEAGRNITVGLRGGSQIGSNALLYFKGGYSNGEITLRYDDLMDNSNDVEESESRGGYHLGAGAEVQFAGRAYGKLEYVYTDYDDYLYEDADYTAGADLNRHQIVVGFGIRF